MPYFTPTTVPEALALMERPGIVPIAGGTDVMVKYSHAVPHDLDLLDLTRIAGLSGVSQEVDHWRIGATTSWSALLKSPLPTAFDGLKQAAQEVGSVQIQNAGTIAGNLCNASPAADGVPPLLALNAKVELLSKRGTRHLPLESFIIGPRKTALEEDEIISAIIVPNPNPTARGHFLKLGSRSYLVISIAMVAVVVSVADGRIDEIAISVGSCGPVATRLPDLEQRLVGQPNSALARSGLILQSDLSTLSPIDDNRATAKYRLSAAASLIQRCLVSAIDEAPA